mgnify:CR=1 FL=1
MITARGYAGRDQRSRTVKSRGNGVAPIVPVRTPVADNADPAKAEEPAA